MRFIASAVLSLVILATRLVAQEDIPAPSVTRVDYAKPEKYLELYESMGTESRIRDVAVKLKAKTSQRTLVAINDWIAKNLKYDPSAAYAWRGFDEAVDARCYGGCADYAVVFAALARACDIPTVFVKTLDVAWIFNYRQHGIEDSWSGHVFLEVYLDGQWRLLDPEACTLYDDYNTASRILPGPRYAYDKGSDPRALPLSTDWERWKQQTATHFSKFDLAELFHPDALPAVGAGRVLQSPNSVHIAANSPIWQALTARCQALGYRVARSFNGGFEQYLPMARESRLIVACVGRQIVLPDDQYDEYLPLAAAKLREKTARGEKGMLLRRLDDGTKVLLIYAQNDAQMLKLLETWMPPSDW
jgi:transglutaminase-like putative cysteine protease